MNAILVPLALVISLSSFSWPQTLNWNPFNLPATQLEDTFQACEMDTDTMDLISISDSQGQITTVDVGQVLETEVVTTIETAEVEVWYELLPEQTVLMGVGLIMYDVDTVDNRDSFFIFMNDSQESVQWWIAIFRENIFTAPQGTVDTWILEEANFCGLFEIAIPSDGQDA
jgi:hypothetical protein